jgi:hypothetical protein
MDMKHHPCDHAADSFNFHPATTVTPLILISTANAL